MCLSERQSLLEGEFGVALGVLENPAGFPVGLLAYLID
jgi:hypothetical protein